MDLADRKLDFVVRDRIRFGRGAVSQLPELVREARGRRAFIVTDAGVVLAGVIDAVRTVSRSGRDRDRRLRRGRAESRD